MVYIGPMSLKKRLRPLWVTLHWGMALLVFVAFGIGMFSLVDTPNTTTKLLPLGVHIIIGISILLIVVARYLLRLLVFKPARRAASAPAAPRKKFLLDRMTPYVHLLLYFFTAFMALLGLAIALPANLFPIIFAGSGQSLPVSFYIYPARAWHGTISFVLGALIAQHVLVAIFHQFIRGENYLGRMWFTRQ